MRMISFGPSVKDPVECLYLVNMEGYLSQPVSKQQEKKYFTTANGKRTNTSSK